MPSTKGISIWVYDDEGVSALSMRSVLTSFAQKLPINYISAIHRISSQEILAQSLQGKGCIIMPGGADLPYCKRLNGRGNEIIKQFIAQGNLYIGICAGGYYGAREIAFTGQDYQIHGERELAFFSGKAIGSIPSVTNGQFYDETTTSKAIVQLDFNNDQQEAFYYHGGAYFVSQNTQSFHSIARYNDGSHAVISGEFGLGKYLLSGVHFELDANIYAQMIIQSKQHNDLVKEQQLLNLLARRQYGQRIFDEIKIIIEQTFKCNNLV